MRVYDYYLSKSDINNDLKKQTLEVGRSKNEILKKQKENNHIKFYPIASNLQNFPQNSTLIKILFTLKKYYTSKNEGEFYIMDNRILENPIVRDKFTGLPMIKPSTWKGHLRFSARKVEWNEKEKKKQIIKRLFGAEPEEKDNPIKGRLYFFPTFFKENAERDVITPLKRDTGIPARGPINLEVIKPDKQGEFYLLYFPYPQGENYNQSQVYKDLKFLAEALKLMFYTYGFSAKKTSGFGVIKKELTEGKLWIKIDTNVKEKKFSTLDDLKNIIDELELKQ